MTGFLGSLGSFGAGLAPQLDSLTQQLQQQKGQGDFGNALAQIYGGGGAQPNSSGPLGGITTALQGLFGGGQQPSGQPQQFAQPAVAQPAVAQGGGGLPGQMQGQGPASQPQPSAQPQASPQPQAPPQQPQPQQPTPKPPAQDQQQGSGPLDLPTLVKHLVANGVTGHRLGAAVDKFIPLLNAQGLQQYRQLGLQLNAERTANTLEQGKFDRDTSNPGGKAGARVANQGIAVQRMEGVQKRFETRLSAAAEKLKNAKTDKEAVDAKKDLDSVAKELRGELQSELNIVNSSGASAEEISTAVKKVGEIQQQISDASDAAIKAHRAGVGNDKADIASAQANGAKETAFNAEGKQVTWNGKQPKSDPKNWTEDSGGQ